MECPCLFTDRGFVYAVVQKLLLTDPHEKQFLHIIQNLGSFLLQCDQGDALGHIICLDLLILLQNGVDGRGSLSSSAW